MTNIAVQSHFVFDSNAGKDIIALIVEMIELAKTQPDGATITVIHERVPVHARASDTIKSVYEHYQATALRRMIPSRPAPGRRHQRG